MSPAQSVTARREALDRARLLLEAQAGSRETRSGVDDVLLLGERPRFPQLDVDVPLGDAALTVDLAAREGLTLTARGRLLAELSDPGGAGMLRVHLSLGWAVSEVLPHVCAAVLESLPHGRLDRFALVCETRRLMGRGVFAGPGIAAGPLAGYVAAQLHGSLAPRTSAWTVLGLALWAQDLVPDVLPAARAMLVLDQAEDAAHSGTGALRRLYGASPASGA